MLTIDHYRDWEGTIDDLAATAAKILKMLGRGHIMAPNIRLIRDYAQRGILSQGDRRGKEVYYAFQHLKELVAARILVSEGVPLAKIAEQFMRDRDIVIVTLGIPGQADSLPATAARERWESLASGFSGPLREAKETGGEASALFMQRALEDAGQKVELHHRLQRLGAGTGEPQVDRMVRVKLTDWCWLFIDAEKLRDLSLEDADDIGRAISATLTDPRVKKGDKL
jgi:DNA-binding transcriptional MerR regulator